MLYIGPQLDLAIFNYRLLRRNIEQQKGITTLSASVIPSLPTQSKNLKKIWLLIYMFEIFLPNWSQNISWFSSRNSYWTFFFHGVLSFYLNCMKDLQICAKIVKLSHEKIHKRIFSSSVAALLFCKKRYQTRKSLKIFPNFLYFLASFELIKLLWNSIMNMYIYILYKKD